MGKPANYNHNDFIFQSDGRKVTLIRDFDGMYSQCDDPHGQSAEMNNLSYQLVLKTLERAVSILQPKRNEPLSVVDLGCGLGYFTACLQQTFQDLRVSGVDISTSALHKARIMAPACRFEQVDLKAPGLRINDGEKFDIAVALDSLYYFEDHEIDDVIKNISSLLKDDGFLMVGYHLPEKMGFGLYLRSLDDARKLLAGNSIEIVYSFDVYNALDKTYADAPVGRHLYFLAQKRGEDRINDSSVTP